MNEFYTIFMRFLLNFYLTISIIILILFAIFVEYCLDILRISEVSNAMFVYAISVEDIPEIYLPFEISLNSILGLFMRFPFKIFLKSLEIHLKSVNFIHACLYDFSSKYSRNLFIILLIV